MLPWLRVVRTLRFTRPGSLLPWLGPALRGLLARPFKERVCQHPPAERDTRWVHCQGCPHMADCPFGQTLEPDPPPGADIFRGQEQAARPLVLALPFPMPQQVEAGDETAVTMTLLGSSALRHEAAVWQALGAAGAEHGFDPDTTTFTLGDEDQRDGPVPIDLPLQVDGPWLERVRVELLGPLFLRTRDAAGRRQHLQEPSFSDLLRASLRTLGTLFALYDTPLPADFAGLKKASEEVPLQHSEYQSFHQRHWSNRSGARMLHGVIGGGTYGPVPESLVSWLTWGGRVHVGTDRVAGAGGWRVWVDYTARGPF